MSETQSKVSMPVVLISNSRQMNRDQIVKLIEKYKFTANEALIIQQNFQNFTLSIEFTDEQILSVFDSVIKVVKDDFVCFQLAELKNKIIQSISVQNEMNPENKRKEADFEDDLNDKEEMRGKWVSKKERERIKKLEEYLDKYEDDLIRKDLVDFIYESYPDTYKEVNKSVLGEGCRNFLKKMGTDNINYLNKKYAEKWKIIQSSIDKEVELRKQTIDKNNIHLHKSEYLDWCLENDIKDHTKQSLKLFLKEYHYKFSESIIEEIQQLVNTQINATKKSL